MHNNQNNDVWKQRLLKITAFEEPAVKSSALPFRWTPQADAIADIKQNQHSTCLLIIHFDYRLALKAIEGGIDKVRINPRYHWSSPIK